MTAPGTDGPVGAAAVERALDAAFGPASRDYIVGRRLRDDYRWIVESTLTAALEPGSVVLSAGDVADLRLVLEAAEVWLNIAIEDVGADSEHDTIARRRMARLRALLPEEGE